MLVACILRMLRTKTNQIKAPIRRMGSNEKIRVSTVDCGGGCGTASDCANAAIGNKRAAVMMDDRDFIVFEWLVAVL